MGSCHGRSPGTSFPAYDAPVPTSKSGGKGTKGQEARETDEGMVSQVQRALNQTRKAEVRLQRLLKDRDKAEAQWQNYVVEAREAFYKEKDRHARALKVFERDIQEAHHQQSDARRVLRDQVLRAEQEADGDAMEEEAVDGEWERMIEAYERESVLADDAVLRRALYRKGRGEDRRLLPRGPDLRLGSWHLRLPMPLVIALCTMAVRQPCAWPGQTPTLLLLLAARLDQREATLVGPVKTRHFGGHQGLFQSCTLQGCSAYGVQREAPGPEERLDAFWRCPGARKRHCCDDHGWRDARDTAAPEVIFAARRRLGPTGTWRCGVIYLAPRIEVSDPLT